MRPQDPPELRYCHPQTPVDPSKTPSRASNIPPRRPCGSFKNLDFLCVFQWFRFAGPAWSCLGPRWPPRRLQEHLRALSGASRRLQEPAGRVQKPPRHPQVLQRCGQDTSPRAPKIYSMTPKSRWGTPPWLGWWINFWWICNIFWVHTTLRERTVAGSQLRFHFNAPARC